MKKSEKNHVIKKLRKTIGDSQEAFAERVGVVKDSIYSIECGRLKLSEKLASRISVITGADFDHLKRGELKIIEDFQDPEEPLYPEYSRDFFNAYTAVEFNKDSSWKIKIKALGFHMERLAEGENHRLFLDGLVMLFEVNEELKKL